VEDCGGTAYLAFKGNTTGGVGGIYERMFHLFCLNKEEYLRHYHRRSNVESVLSAVKRKFGDSVRSKTETAMKNEVLGKLICHNISCLIHTMYELRIEPDLKARPNADSRPIIRIADFL
jgi:transposase